MRPAVLAKMEELVLAGGTILGGKPTKSPSLQNYPRCDTEIQEIANRMWGESHSGGNLKTLLVRDMCSMAWESRRPWTLSRCRLIFSRQMPRAVDTPYHSRDGDLFPDKPG